MPSRAPSLNVAVLENARVVSRSRPAGYDISNKGNAITNGLDVDGVKLLAVYKCYGIFFVWTYDPEVDTIDGPDNTWKVSSIIKLPLDSARFPGIDRNCRFCFAIGLETLWITLHAANTETPNKSPITF